MLLEQGHYFVAGGLATGNFDTVHGTGGDVDHLLELWMIESLNWLQKGLLLDQQ
jgi:hypothetical protein